MKGTWKLLSFFVTPKWIFSIFCLSKRAVRVNLGLNRIRNKSVMTLSFKPMKFLMLTAMLTVFSGCAQHATIQKELKNSDRIAQDALDSLEPTNVIDGPLIVDERPWYGGKAVPISKGDPLPAKFIKEDGIVVTFSEPMSLTQLRSEVQKVTGIRVLYDRAGTTNEARFLPADGLQVTGGRVVWQGSLSDLLNQVADAYDIGWDYKNGVIRLYQEVSKTFMLHALAAGITLDGSLETGTNSSSGLPTVNIEDTTELEIWDEIGEVLGNITGNRARLSLSPSTGTITVSGSPTTVDRVEEYLRQQNALRLRRVAVAIKVLSVEINNNSSYGFDLFAEVQDAFDNQPYQLSSVDGSLSAGIIRQAGSFAGLTRSGTFDDFAAVLSASEDIGHVAITNSGAVVTLSDQPAPLQIGRQISYLERVSASASGDSTGTSLEPGVVDVGLTMNILPRVIENNRVLMRLAISITDAEEPFQTFSSSDATIQLPEIETTGFLQNAVLSQGETLVLAGFERQQSGITDNRSLGWLLGGTRTLDRNREITVLLISAEILPEDPVTIVNSSLR